MTGDVCSAASRGKSGRIGLSVARTESNVKNALNLADSGPGSLRRGISGRGNGRRSSRYMNPRGASDAFGPRLTPSWRNSLLMAISGPIDILHTSSKVLIESTGSDHTCVYEIHPGDYDSDPL